jgi:sugar phosphate isomerase/epimerase
MRLGAFTSAIDQFELEEGLRLLADLGLATTEVTCAGYFDQRHADPARLLADDASLVRWRDCFRRCGLEVSAFAIHGQPLSPNSAKADAYSQQFRQVCKLAEAVGVRRLTLLAGLPEAAAGDSSPCFVLGPFPPENLDAYRWQWEERVLPYWREHAKVAENHGCLLCFEMQVGDVVYNPDTLMRLRREIGPVVGCNFDPSHLVWQGIDVCEALRFLGDAVYHVHAKDIQLQYQNTRLNGVLDPTPFAQVRDRAWLYRTVGYGQSEQFWRDLLTTLRSIGYDDAVSIEHDDRFMDPVEGLQKAVAFLRPLISDKPWDEGPSHVLAATDRQSTR